MDLVNSGDYYCYGIRDFRSHFLAKAVLKVYGKSLNTNCTIFVLV